MFILASTVMNYYEIIPATSKYHGGALTYSSVRKLAIGQVVGIEIKGLKAVGFIASAVKQPDFAVKPMSEIFDQLVLAASSLELFYWMQSYYPGPLGALANQFMPPNISTVSKKMVMPSTVIADKIESPVLSLEQSEALNFINNQRTGTFLVHGETGSGKTRLYIELAKKEINAGKSVLMLTPEISLTPQLLDRFSAVFGDTVSATHSNISPAQRKLLWLSLLKATEPKILIGPRSALFMPLRVPGVIIVDEFHDQAYKQENTPYYQALRVASKMAQIHSAKLVLGSATPSINEYFFALQKQAPVLTMVSKPALRGTVQSPTKVDVVDLSDIQERTKYPLISTTLLREIRTCLDRGEQAMIFLNKRGSARAVVCQTCGWQALCPRCDLPLVYHSDTHTLHCHTCGFSEPTPSACPSCNSAEILFKSPGTKAVAGFLKSLFPEARIARFDKDNAKADRLETRYTDIKDGSIDILVGTQLLTKGHDLPNLSLVGILLAETGLVFPDYTAEEHSYQIIRQLLGRVGRGHRPGFAVVQTFDPENTTIQAAVSGSWEDFYNDQLLARKAFGFPPFFHVMKIHVLRKSQASAKKAAEKLAKIIQTGYTNAVVVGPSPSFIEKRGDMWHWQIIVKSKNRGVLVSIIKTLPKSTIADIDPSHLL